MDTGFNTNYSFPTNIYSRVGNVSLVNMHFIPNYKNILFWCSSGHSVGNISRIGFWKSLWHFCYVCWCRIFYCKQSFSSCTKFCVCSLHSCCTNYSDFFISVLFIQISSKEICLKKHSRLHYFKLLSMTKYHNESISKIKIHVNDISWHNIHLSSNVALPRQNINTILILGHFMTHILRPQESLSY